MKCAIHSDQHCIEACRGCGRLVCETCDVAYAGRHFCKSCVASVARPLQRFDPRPWSLRAIDLLFQRWYAVLALSVGLMALASAVITLEAVGSSYPHTFNYQMLQPGAVNTWYGSGLTFSKSTLSIWLQMSAWLVMLGVFMFAKRFSLRWMLTGVLLVVALGAYPFLRISGNPDLTEALRIQGPKSLSAAEFADIQYALQPDAALATLPPALFHDLELSPRACIQAVTVLPGMNGDRRGIECRVEVNSELNEIQRATLQSFYRHYATELVTGQTSSVYDGSNSAWSRYEAAWLARIHPPAMSTVKGF